MSGISCIPLSGHKRIKQAARENLASDYRIFERLQDLDVLSLLKNTLSLSGLDACVKSGRSLSFEEAAKGMCYVLAATNKHFFEACRDAFSENRILSQGTAFLQLMAVKEALWELTPEEVAGMAAVGLIDPVVRPDFSEVVETCGMGGDKGFCNDRTLQKTINVSTLSALVLSSLDVPVLKHGSYSNTSAMGSTEAIEVFGARTVMRSESEIMRLWDQCGFCYLDAHLVKTIHDLSHLLMMETVNHIIGPMTLPVARETTVHKLMGVNEKIHPECVVRAYNILHKKGLQRLGGIMVIGGLDESGSHLNPDCVQGFREHCILDEFSPHASVVSVGYGSDFLGNCLLSPKDFGVDLDPETVKVPNTREDIYQANVAALRGSNPDLANYLAMNAALGLYLRRYVTPSENGNGFNFSRTALWSCFEECRQIILSGKAWETLTRYVAKTEELLSN